MRRIRWAAAALALLGVAACGPVPPAVPRPAAAPQASRAVPVGKVTYPARGTGEWRTAPASARTAGERGPLLRYRVLVERDIRGLSAATFAATVTSALADPRGWTAGGTLRLRRSGPGMPYDFTIFLATPRTRDALCGHGPDGFTSCRHGDRVVLNVARWVKGVPGYGAPLSVYRQYMVNHEVGHRLGQGHERCPGRGRPAPVMQQQTLGLHGCDPNPWPYRAGERYAGPSGAYADRLPAPDRGRR
ncbi:lipoprotein [Actinoplanes sp. NBRC 14428]|nr:lipoprotein [Actinoplanes sp. NBRC 14428]